MNFRMNTYAQTHTYTFLLDVVRAKMTQVTLRRNENTAELKSRVEPLWYT